MTTMAFQITSLMVVCSTVYSDADQRKHQSSASLACVWGIHRDRWISRTNGQLRGKCFHLMTSSWLKLSLVEDSFIPHSQHHLCWYPGDTQSHGISSHGIGLSCREHSGFSPGGLKLRSHMRGAVAGRRRADFEIPAPLPRVCSHIRGADAGGSAISWGQWWFGARGFEADAANWVLDPFLAERFLPPLRHRSAAAHVWTHVMICVEANFPPASARARPRMCERTLRHCDLLDDFVKYCLFYFFCILSALVQVMARSRTGGGP